MYMVSQKLFDDAHLDDGLGLSTLGLSLLHPASLPRRLLPDEHHSRYHYHSVRQHQERAER